MKNVSLRVWFKQRRLLLGGLLVAIAITACTAIESPPSVATASPTAGTSIASSSRPSPISIAQSRTETNPAQQQAVQVIRNYYTALARQDYSAAYIDWDGNGAASGQSFEQFVQGFANTACTAVEVEEPGQPSGAAGSLYIEVPVTVTAITTGGTPQRFQGSYVLRRVDNVPGSTVAQRQWHLYSANLTQVN